MTPFRLTSRVFLMPVVLAAALAACSAGGQPSPGSNGPGGADGPSSTASAVPLDSTVPGAVSSPASTAPDPCSLLTDAQANRAFGGPTAHKAGKSKDASIISGSTVTETLCEWDLVTSDQLGHDLWIAVYAGADRNYFNNTVDGKTAIPGLGDAAAGDSNVYVYVFSKGTVLQLYGSLPGTDSIQAVAAVAITNL